MTGLIDAAREYNIEFVFALSPGLDITFSNAKDVQALKRKLEQVRKISYGYKVSKHGKLSLLE